MPMRLGDGTPIPADGFQEVRLGQGDVLWSSEQDYGADIVHQWSMSEGSGTTLSDSHGDADATINGADWDSSSHDWYDGHALSGNGSGDYVDTGVNDSDGSQVSVALTVVHSYSGSDAGGIENLATSGYDGDTPWEVRFNGTDLEFSIWDGGNSNHYLLTEPISSLSPDHPHRVVAQYGGGNMELWVDGTLVDSGSAPVAGLGGSSQRLLFAHDDAGTISGFFGGMIDNFIIFDGMLPESGIQADLNNQPWPVDDTGGEAPSTGGDVYINGEPQPNSDGPFGIHEGDVDASQAWTLDAADDFEGSLADSNWHAGFGFGNSHGRTEEEVRDEDVWVSSDDKLTIQTLPDGNGGWHGGAANTYAYMGDGWNSSTSPDVAGTTGYWEASVKMPEPIPSFIPGFWCRGAEDLSGSSGWPPEVDFVERFGWSNGYNYRGTVHYDNTDETEEAAHTADELLSSNYNVYGAHWTEDYIDFYFNGQFIDRTTEGHGTGSHRLESQEQYALLTMHVWITSWNGDDPDMSADYPVLTEMDWFRRWDFE